MAARILVQQRKSGMPDIISVFHHNVDLIYAAANLLARQYYRFVRRVL
jgi:hypothetical protein